MNYVATFFTHAAALKSFRSLNGNGYSARMAPVPRALSSSCGTCVFFEGTDPALELMDRDVEAVYQQSENGYQSLMENK